MGGNELQDWARTARQTLHACRQAIRLRRSSCCRRRDLPEAAVCPRANKTAAMREMACQEVWLPATRRCGMLARKNRSGSEPHTRRQISLMCQPLCCVAGWLPTQRDGRSYTVPGGSKGVVRAIAVVNALAARAQCSCKLLMRKASCLVLTDESTVLLSCGCPYGSAADAGTT